MGGRSALDGEGPGPYPVLARPSTGQALAEGQALVTRAGRGKASRGKVESIFARVVPRGIQTIPKHPQKTQMDPSTCLGPFLV